MLGDSFFCRDTKKVARELLGMVLVRRWRGKELASLITEVEAYDGFRDRASHASRGRTARNAPMFGPPGYWYVYFTYGMHWMLNIVTREEGYPAAVLIRGITAVSGPGRLTKFLHIDKKLNGKPAVPATGLWIESRGGELPRRKIKRTPRIGVAYAGEEWAAKKWRFLLA